MMQQNSRQFGVIGSGAWGTALAASILRAGHSVVLWAHAATVSEAINQKHENTVHLPGIKLDERLKATLLLSELQDCDAWIMATPAQRLRKVAQELRDVAPKNAGPVIIAAKGIESGTSALMSEVVAAELPRHPLAILSGPSFASEVAHGKPAALTLATKYRTLGEELSKALATPSLRLYRTDDVVGAQIGGAVKNVLAVACGIVAGKEMGENARAAIITRGLAEILRLGLALGARNETMMGLSGVGDLVLTCSSLQSRNTSLGLALGQGKKLKDILATRASVTEGVPTAAAAHILAERHKVDMPIVAAVDAILNQDANIDQTISELLARPQKSEAHEVAFAR